MLTDLKHLKAIILLLIGTLFWGMTFVFIKESIEHIDVYSFLFWRFLLAGVSLRILFFRKTPPIELSSLGPSLITGVILFSGYITQTIGLIDTSASKGAFITGLAVVFVPLMLTIKERRLPELNLLAATSLATAGLWLLTVSSAIALNRGDVWVLACALFFALHILIVSKYSGKIDPVNFATVQLLTVALITGTIATLKGTFQVPGSYVVWRDIIFCALFATSFMYLIQARYQQFISETQTAVIFSFEPLFGALTAWIYLGETFTGKTIAGGILIFTAMLIAEYKQEPVKQYVEKEA